ncbi:MAG: phosphoribosylformylglycinamidine synthase subunit PurQ [Bowdeniella nasicola]|nr:phosphoribosylformylglycinamidine synthase subunit PurQ [Bowdeniella nasicola]
MRIGVVTFPGTLDDRDALRAVRLTGAQAVPLWHADTDLTGIDAVILPGGFSYGDYLRCGAIARFAPIMDRVVDAARGSMPVLGICNGFQVLCEAHLLPGALVKNDHQRFICRDQDLRVERTETPFTCAFTSGQSITIPMKNGEGQFVADEQALTELEESGRVVFRYEGFNPNGSMNDIAGICNERGNVVGLMPHPEHAVEAGYGPDGPFGPRTGTDGAGFFTSLIATLLR